MIMEGLEEEQRASLRSPCKTAQIDLTQVYVLNPSTFTLLSTLLIHYDSLFGLFWCLLKSGTAQATILYAKVHSNFDRSIHLGSDPNSHKLINSHKYSATCFQGFPDYMFLFQNHPT